MNHTSKLSIMMILISLIYALQVKSKTSVCFNHVVVHWLRYLIKYYYDITKHYSLKKGWNYDDEKSESVNNEDKNVDKKGNFW